MFLFLEHKFKRLNFVSRLIGLNGSNFFFKLGSPIENTVNLLNKFFGDFFHFLNVIQESISLLIIGLVGFICFFLLFLLLNKVFDIILVIGGDLMKGNKVIIGLLDESEKLFELFFV